MRAVHWNRLVPQDRGQDAEPRTERPPREAHGKANDAKHR